jgi:hypothetical protein
MKKSLLKRLVEIVALLLIFQFNGCLWIISVVQPPTATPGETITVTMYVGMDETFAPGGGPSYGLTAIMIPLDWSVQSIEFDGDYGPEIMEFLHPDSSDIQPGGGVNYWYDTLMVRYPPPAGMDWVVYQGVEGHLWVGDTSYITVTYQLTVGAAGNYDIWYFASTTDLSFEDPGYTDISQGNQINISTTAIEETSLPGVPTKFALEQNYPNPFNPSTTIRYSISERAEVKLAVYDLAGRQVALLTSGVKNLGSYQLDFTAENLASGIYIYQLTAGEFIQSKKMALVR